MKRGVRILKVEDRIAKSDFSAPSTVGEVAADSPAQAADRAAYAHKQALERKLVFLQSKLESAWEYGDKAAEKRLAEAIEQTMLELGAIRAVPILSPDESLRKTDRARGRDALNTVMHMPSLKKGDLADPFELSNDLGIRSQNRVKE